MATGPEHYREAEGLLSCARESVDAPNAVAKMLAEAQIHAILALAAATAMSHADSDGMSDLDFIDWDRVCGVEVDSPSPGVRTAGPASDGHQPD